MERILPGDIVSPKIVMNAWDRPELEHMLTTPKPIAVVHPTHICLILWVQDPTWSDAPCYAYVVLPDGRLAWLGIESLRKHFQT